MIMYSIKRWVKHVTGFCLVDIAAGTNCPQGGDAGHGGRTFLEVHQECGYVDVEVWINGKCERFYGASGFRVMVAGDDECRWFARALSFGLECIRKSWPDILKDTRGVTRARLNGETSC